MSAATILFADIVAFSRKATPEQRRLVESLTAEVVAELGDLLNSQTAALSVIALPTGDGLALAFIHGAQQSWNHSTVLRLIFKMHQWAEGQSSAQSSVSLRVGVHVGPIELISDINGRTNLCGDTINYAQRVMDAANPRQTLYSDVAFRAHIGSESASFRVTVLGKEFKGEFRGPIDVYAKHGLQISVYKACLEPQESFWSDDDPASKQHMLVTLTPLPKEVVGTFSETIQHATSIGFVQLTGDRFLSSFHEGNIKFSKQLKRFWVFMPTPEVYSGFHLTKPQAPADFVATCVQKWQEFFVTLKAQFPNADLKLGLFKEPPYFGASFIDWERPGGKIHVSPYVWNVAAPACPGYDVQWVGKTPSAIYETYVEGLRYLNQSTGNELTR